MCLALDHCTAAAVSVLKSLLALAGLGVSPSASVRKESLVLQNENGFTARQARLDPRSGKRDIQEFVCHTYHRALGSNRDPTAQCLTGPELVGDKEPAVGTLV